MTNCNFVIVTLQTQAQKMDSVELNGSHVARAWTVFIDETEKMVKYIKENAEFLANNTIDKINSLYAVRTYSLLDGRLEK